MLTFCQSEPCAILNAKGMYWRGGSVNIYLYNNILYKCNILVYIYIYTCYVAIFYIYVTSILYEHWTAGHSSHALAHFASHREATGGHSAGRLVGCDIATVTCSFSSRHVHFQVFCVLFPTHHHHHHHLHPPQNLVCLRMRKDNRCIDPTQTQ